MDTKGQDKICKFCEGKRKTRKKSVGLRTFKNVDGNGCHREAESCESCVKFWNNYKGNNAERRATLLVKLRREIPIDKPVVSLQLFNYMVNLSDIVWYEFFLLADCEPSTLLEKEKAKYIVQLARNHMDEKKQSTHHLMNKRGGKQKDHSYFCLPICLICLEERQKDPGNRISCQKCLKRFSREQEKEIIKNREKQYTAGTAKLALSASCDSQPLQLPESDQCAFSNSDPPSELPRRVYVNRVDIATFCTDALFMQNIYDICNPTDRKFFENINDSVDVYVQFLFSLEKSMEFPNSLDNLLEMFTKYEFHIKQYQRQQQQQKHSETVSKVFSMANTIFSPTWNDEIIGQNQTLMEMSFEEMIKYHHEATNQLSTVNDQMIRHDASQLKNWVNEQFPSTINVPQQLIAMAMIYSSQGYQQTNICTCQKDTLRLCKKCLEEKFTSIICQLKLRLERVQIIQLLIFTKFANLVALNWLEGKFPNDDFNRIALIGALSLHKNREKYPLLFQRKLNGRNNEINVFLTANNFVENGVSDLPMVMD